MAVLPAATDSQDARFGSKITFRSCHLLNVSQRLAVLILAIKVFAACSSLASEDANQFCSSTKFGHCLFEIASTQPPLSCKKPIINRSRKLG